MAKHRLSLTVQYADADSADGSSSLSDVVTRGLLRRWVQAALLAPAELTLRFVGTDEGRTLNRDYRGKDYATNVLTFPYSNMEADADAQEPTRADIVFCSEVLRKEALAQGKPVLAHAAHLVVHGVLHAQGYDHEEDAGATEMEALEVEMLATLGFADPYLEQAGAG